MSSCIVHQGSTDAIVLLIRNQFDTCRAMRPNEVDGIDYIFVTKEKFESWIKADELLEHALVYGEYKGILRSQIAHALANKQDVILRLDVQGAATMRRLMPDAVSIFLVRFALLHDDAHVMT